MLPTHNYTRTIWNRDAYGVPPGSNLYGAHPVYFDHRGSEGTHGVFLLNSNGMDIKINDTDGQYLEYNTLGGVLDFYFMAGPTPNEVAQQYSDVVGKSAMMPYWGFGFHQCRYGMQVCPTLCLSIGIPRLMVGFRMSMRWLASYITTVPPISLSRQCGRTVSFLFHSCLSARLIQECS